MPARLEQKIGHNVNITFGFSDVEVAKYSDNDSSAFINALENIIFTSVDIILLLQLDNQIIQENFDLAKQAAPKNKDSSLQTGFSFEPIAPQHKIVNGTWNVWDYHRRTIKLANMRQRQTISTQTKLSCFKSNAQNQCCSSKEF